MEVARRSVSLCAWASLYLCLSVWLYAAICVYLYTLAWLPASTRLPLHAWYHWQDEMVNLALSKLLLLTTDKRLSTQIWKLYSIRLFDILTDLLWGVFTCLFNLHRNLLAVSSIIQSLLTAKTMFPLCLLVICCLVHVEKVGTVICEKSLFTYVFTWDTRPIVDEWTMASQPQFDWNTGDILYFLD